MQILVFKTNVSNRKHIKRLVPYMQTMEGVIAWNVDLHDCDKILRIEAKDVQPKLIEHIVTGAGYYCEELHD